MGAPSRIIGAGGQGDGVSVERQVRAAESALRGAGMALDQWHGHGDWAARSWSARRAAAGRALAELEEAAGVLAAAREALAQEIRVTTDRRLSADESRCSAQWGVCPEHGNTLSSSGGRSWCRRPGCGRTWAGSRVGAHCAELAVALVADQDGSTMRLCVGHWTDARQRLIDARVVQMLSGTATGGGAR